MDFLKTTAGVLTCGVLLLGAVVFLLHYFPVFRRIVIWFLSYHPIYLTVGAVISLTKKYLSLRVGIPLVIILVGYSLIYFAAMHRRIRFRPSAPGRKVR